MGRLLGVLLKLVLWGVVLGIPLLGVWVASSMAALLGGPLWIAPLGGALLFPLGPLLWELLALRRARRRQRKRASGGGSFLDDLSRSRRERLRLTFFDRMLWRTLLLNGAFVGGLAYSAPSTVTNALTARGDWMLDQAEGDWVPHTRRVLLAAADLAEGLAKAAEDNPYRDAGKSPPPPPPPSIEQAEAPREMVTVRLPEGAAGRIQGRALSLTGTTEVPLPAGSYEVTVSLPDGSGLMCPLVVTEDTPVLGLVAGDPWHLGMEACEQFRAPDPDWVPSLHRVLYDGVSDTVRVGPGQVMAWHQPDEGARTNVLLGPELIASSEITAVQIREPYLRLQLTEAAAAALCAETGDWSGAELAVVTGDQVRYRFPIFEAVCDGQLSVPMRDSAAQRAGKDAADEITDAQAGADRWPVAATVHPAVQAIPAELEESVQSVGAYLKRAVPEPLDRLKAIHDYVATRVAYDTASLEPGQRQPQDADTVLRRGLGVCAGYANLMVAIGEAAEVRVVYIIGHSRDNQEGGVSGTYHAWNAAEIDGKWYLIDATWDAGASNEQGIFEADYKTDYFLTPPDIFATTHLPEEPAWQLSPAPISRGEFTRRPMMRPSFFAADLSLLNIDRSQITARGPVEVSIANPGGHHIIVEYESENGSRQRCGRASGERVTITCPLQDPGRYDLLVFHREGSPSGDYGYDGKLMVNILP